MEQERIEQAAAQLGASVQIDVEAVAERVVAELRAQPRPARTWWRQNAVVRIAAVFAVLVTGGVIMKQMTAADPGVAIEVPVGLEMFSASELGEVLDSLDLMSPVADMGPVLLDDLDEEQLTALLAAMEG